MENHHLFRILYRLGTASFVVGLLGLTGCAMFQIPTMEDLQRAGVEQARRDLTSPDAARRAEAVEELGGEGTAEAVQLIRPALKDSDPRVRTAAARALKEAGSEGQVAQAELMTSLQAEKDPEAAVAMGWTLSGWRVDLTPALPALRSVLQQPDHFLRYQAALLMSPHVEVMEVAPVYLDTVGTWAEKNLRNKPVEVLSDLVASDGQHLVGLLEAATARINAQQRAAAAKLFSDYRPLPIPGKNVILKLLADPDPVVREAAAHAALMSVPPPDEAGPGLLKLMADPVGAVRAEAVNAIGPLVARRVAPAGALEAMGKAMSDPDAEVRESAALALGHVGELPEAVALQLMARLDPLVETSPEVRANAVSGLARAPKSDALKQALRTGLNDRDPGVRTRALATTGHANVRDEELLNIVLGRTGPQTDKGQRLTAIGCLNDLQWKRDDIVAALQRLSLDPDEDIREAATFAMKQVQAGTP